jgi:hypothetical protein
MNNAMKTKFFLTIVSIFAISGCKTFVPLELEKHGFYNVRAPYSGKVSVTGEFIPEYERLIFVKRLPKTDDEEYEFFVKTVENMKVFDEVVDENELVEFVLKNQMTDNTAINISDRIGLSALASEIGNFLVVECRYNRNYGHLEAFDAKSGKYLLKLERVHIPMYDPGEIFRANFDAFFHWTQGREIVIDQTEY